MRIISSHYQHGETICTVDFPKESESLRRILSTLQPPLYPTGDYSATTRPLRPKRHIRPIGGHALPVLLPVSQRMMNATLKEAFGQEGWGAEPVAAGPMSSPGTPLSLRGDFVRNRVFVEVEFGNVASMDRDFFKFQIANRSGAGDVGVLVVATQRLAYFFDSNVATFESALRRRPFLALAIQMPVWIVGIEPEDFEESIGVRYEEMRNLCQENGELCHSFDSALSAAGETSLVADEEPSE